MFTPAAALLIVLPWLNPFAPGPSPAVVPLLFSWACAAALLGVHQYTPGLTSPHRLVTMTATAWLAAGLVSCAIGLFQYFGGGGDLLPWVSQAELGQAFGNLRQRNQFASLTNIALAALVWFAVRAPVAGHPRYRQALVCLAAGLLAAGNAASSSRTGLVQLFLLCALAGVWGAWRRPLVRWVLLLSVVTYIAAAPLLPGLAGLDPALHGALARLHAGDDACSSRITLWSNVLHLIAQKPWLGWGWGALDYAHYASAYNGLRFCDILDNAHNVPLHLAVELGVPLAVLLCGGAVWWALQRRPWAEAEPARQLAWSVLAIVLLHSLLEYPLWYGPFQMAVGLCVVMLWRRQPAAHRSPPENAGSKRQLWQSVYGFIAIIIIVFCGYAAWDYHRISQLYLVPESRSAAYRTDTLAKAQRSWLFASQVQFAELMTTPLEPGTAVWTFESAGALLHYSPEPRVIEKRIEAAVMLGRDGDALAHLARYRAAFAADHARWAKANVRPKLKD
ncbi:MAG: polymerase [Polaromonas sp.]|nr:MAG: polymerase [Polaromonas sp.]